MIRPLSLALSLAVFALLLLPSPGWGADLLWAPPEIDGGAVDSAGALEQELLLRGRTVTRVGTIAGLDLTPYEAVWVTLGIFPHTRPLTLAEGQQLATYLTGGGTLYIEGGDIWGYDPLTPLNAVDGISASADGTGDLFSIVGSDVSTGPNLGSLSAPYVGENAFIDHLYPDEPGAAVAFSNANGASDVGVWHDGALSGLGDFRLLGVSFEFGGWNGNRALLLERILVALGLEVLCSLAPPTTPTCAVTPNGVALTWQNLAPYTAVEVVRDGAVIATLPSTVGSHLDPTPPAGPHEYRLRGLDGACSATSGACTVDIAATEVFRRGDLNDTGTLDISDAILLLSGLFVPGETLLCPDAGDVNDSGSLDIADPVVLLRALFEGGALPPPPRLASCGADPTPDALPPCLLDCTP